MRVSAVALILAAAFASGCGPDCNTSCEKLFGEGSGECDIQIPGKEGEKGRQEMVSDCIAHCENAMSQAGDIGDYAPNEKSSGNDDVQLENEKQAALWMDCVDETSCTNLDKNYCAPVKNFP